MEIMDHGYRGKRILIVFSDGPNHSSVKRGICTYVHDQFVELDNKHYIPKSKIYRIEVLPK